MQRVLQTSPSNERTTPCTLTLGIIASGKRNNGVPSKMNTWTHWKLVGCYGRIEFQQTTAWYCVSVARERHRTLPNKLSVGQTTTSVCLCVITADVVKIVVKGETWRYLERKWDEFRVYSSEYDFTIMSASEKHFHSFDTLIVPVTHIIRI